jgi:hypothetical protein
MYIILITKPILEHSQHVESLLSKSRTCHATGAQLGAGFRCTRLIGGAIWRVCPGVHGDGCGVPTQFHGMMEANGKDGLEGRKRQCKLNRWPATKSIWTTAHPQLVNRRWRRRERPSSASKGRYSILPQIIGIITRTRCNVPRWSLVYSMKEQR